MTTIHVGDMRHGYIDICRMVMSQGAVVKPRGMETRELLDVVIVLDEPRDALPLGINRKPNKAIAVVEALQLIGGIQTPELVCRIQPNFKQFLDGEAFHGSYGPRLRNQLPHTVQKLLDDRDTRQAVMTIWDPAFDNGSTVKDLPCTTMLQFLIRDGRLILHTTMRSNDVWWGLAYDAFQFTQLQLAVANFMGIPAGPYHHHAVSLHAYERDFDSIEDLIDFKESKPDHDLWHGLTPQSGNWSDVRWHAQKILLGQLEARADEHCERRMLEVLEPYRA